MKHQNQLSPENYIRTRARTLPIIECHINENWQEMGMANIIVARTHVQGNITMGFYLVDTFALGVKDTFFRFNISMDEFIELLEKIKQGMEEQSGAEYIRTDYKTVHNIIYGALAFAEEYDYKPCKEFNVTKYILEEDDEKIELIEYEFGRDGKPLLINL